MLVSGIKYQVLGLDKGMRLVLVLASWLLIPQVPALTDLIIEAKLRVR